MNSIVVLIAMALTAFYVFLLCGAPAAAGKIIGLTALWFLGGILFFLMIAPGPVRLLQWVIQAFYNP
jgi:hypothetical protein